MNTENGTTPAISLERRVAEIYADIGIIDKPYAVYELIASLLDSNTISIDDFFDAFHKDNNLISLSVAECLVEHGYIPNISSFGFEGDELYQLLRAKPSSIAGLDFRSPSFPNAIPEGERTEVYFWGLPNSGKKTVLGGILNVAGNGRYTRSMSMDSSCQDYGYMAYLASVFNKSNQICVFPSDAGWSYTNNVCLDFELEENRGAIHPISCISIASGAYEVMYRSECGMPLSSDAECFLDELVAFLSSKKTKNKKIHFFIIDYCKEPREYSGLPQSIYLEAALHYLERNGVFQKETDRLVLIISKVDRAKADGQHLRELLEEYISENFLGFYRYLKQISMVYEINRGDVDIYPFSIGKVFFQDYFRFDDKYAASLVNLLLEITPKRKTNHFFK